MSRLTQKFGDDYDIKSCNEVIDPRKQYQAMCNKLGRLEDIEEELGIDLMTLSKVFEIIKKKTVDFTLLPYCGIVGYYNHQVMMSGDEKYKLTKKEFDLLMEVFFK